ncbi:MAG: von Willebrand factor type A domain-containing protein [Verrucomicrobia bacterium]|nr:von Willebrand factor type A domain-containing protein [Verrucomicrobiota bacterium]
MNDHHHHHTLLPDDPRITAFALGELEGDDRAAVEAALRHDPALRAMVDDIRATAGLIRSALTEELAKDAAEDTAAGKIVAFPTTGAPVPTVPGDDPASDEGAPAARTAQWYPRFYYIVGGLAAACFALLAVLTPPPPAAPKPAVAEKAGKVYVDMNTVVRPAPSVAVAPPPADRAEPEAGPRTAPPKIAPTREEAVHIVAGTDQKASRTLLEQAKDIESAAAGQRPQALTLSATAAAPLRLSSTPHRPDPKAVPGLAAASDRGAIFNESRGMPGAGLKDITQGRDFDTVKPAGPDQPPDGLMHLSPFTVSVDRMRARAAEAAAAKAKAEAQPAAPARLLADARAFEPTDEPLALLPARAGRGSGNTEVYGLAPDNGFLSARQNPFSSFSVDTDTTSYANVQRFVQGGKRPPREAVRIEELLNQFPYSYPPPAAKSEAPFATTLEVSEAPWAPTHRLVRIGLKGREITTAERPAANLVFLLDVSGSMNAPNRLPLVKESMRMLLTKLRADDRVAIVTYAGQSGLALPSTPVAQAPEILTALDNLAAGGSTNGAMGIQLAYDIAKANRVDGGINRVILCTDGDFNVGVTSEAELTGLIEEKAKSGVFLTVLGYGMANRKDGALEQLASRGNGNFGYIDSRREAEKLLVQQVNGTLVTLAKDVKIRVEFNPAQVSSYRLIGYENRLLKKEEFADDKMDAGELGAGHTVTALYEVVPVGAAAKTGRRVAEAEVRRYNFYGGVTDTATLPGRTDPYGQELLTVKVRYKKPGALFSRAVDYPLTDAGGTFHNASPDFKFAAAVAGFGMILRESPYRGTTTMANVIEWAEAGAAEDAGGYRSEFIELARHTELIEK